MRTFRNVLALYGAGVGDESALDCATRLVAADGGRLTLVDVVYEETVSNTLLDERRRHLERIAESVRFRGVDAAAVVLAGRPHEELVRKVIRDGHDLVVLADDRTEGLQELVFGCTCLNVLRKAPCPVWIVRPEPAPQARHVLALVTAPAQGAPEGLDVKVLVNAAGVARAHGAVLHVLKVWEVDGPDAETLYSETPQPVKCRIKARHRERHQRAVQALLRTVDLAGLDHQVHLPQGDVAGIVPDFVTEHAVDLVVIGTNARGTIADLVFRPTAESMLAKTGRPVLAVKPDDFVSPLAVPGY